MNAISATSSDRGESGRVRRGMFNAFWETVLAHERMGDERDIPEFVTYRAEIRAWP